MSSTVTSMLRNPVAFLHSYARAFCGCRLPVPNTAYDAPVPVGECVHGHDWSVEVTETHDGAAPAARFTTAHGDTGLPTPIGDAPHVIVVDWDEGPDADTPSLQIICPHDATAIHPPADAHYSALPVHRRRHACTLWFRGTDNEIVELDGCKLHYEVGNVGIEWLIGGQIDIHKVIAAGQIPRTSGTYVLAWGEEGDGEDYMVYAVVGARMGDAP